RAARAARPRPQSGARSGRDLPAGAQDRVEDRAGGRRIETVLQRDPRDPGIAEVLGNDEGSDRDPGDEITPEPTTVIGADPPENRHETPSVPRRRCRHIARHQAGRYLLDSARLPTPRRPGNPVNITTTKTSRVSPLREYLGSPASARPLHWPHCEAPLVAPPCQVQLGPAQPSRCRPAPRAAGPGSRRSPGGPPGPLGRPADGGAVLLVTSDPRDTGGHPARARGRPRDPDRAGAVRGRSGTAAGPAPTGVEQVVVGHADRPQPGHPGPSACAGYGRARIGWAS